MLVVDVIAVALIAAAAIYGWVAGIGRALPVAGFAAGVVLGSRLPLLVGEELDSNSALVIALPAALIAGGIVAGLAERLAPFAARLVGRSVLAEGLAGALLVGAAGAVLAWAVAPAASEIGSVRDEVERSEVLERFNAVLTPAGTRREEAPAPDLPEEFAGGAGQGPARAPGLLSNIGVRRADRNLVKVETDRCGNGYQGTGWVAGHGIVVTNAHVVTASKKVTVLRRGKGSPLDATVIWFDGIHDLALLEVPALRGLTGLPLAEDPRPRTSGFALGFPGGRKSVRRARLAQTTTQVKVPPLKLANRAGVSLTMNERLVTIVRGVSGPGGSGGPVIDRRGNVLATVFSGIEELDIVLAVPNRIVRSAIRRARAEVPVPACHAPPLKPTAKESIAARNA
jgi:S1-C subfamily serine protease